MAATLRWTRVFCAVVAGAWFFVGIGAAQGAPIPGVSTLQDVINLNAGDPFDGVPEGGIIIGDKQFYDFDYTGSGLLTPSASDINVSRAPGSAVGLEFQAGWAALSGFNMDSRIGYKVHVLDPGQFISAVNLVFNGTASGLAFAEVVETIQKLDGTVLGTLSVVVNPTDSLPEVYSDSLSISPPLRDIIVRKDIQVFTLPASVGGGKASISFVDNAYVQIPEPATLGLLTLGLPLLLRRRR